MTAPAYLLTPRDPYDEAQLLHPGGTRETVAAIGWPRPFALSLAAHGYLAPWPAEPLTRYRLAPLPEMPCPPWCPGTPTAHRLEADDRARVYLEHARHITAAAEASVIVGRIDLCHPLEVGSASLSVLGDGLGRGDALALAEAITAATAHLPEAPAPATVSGSDHTGPGASGREDRS